MRDTPRDFLLALLAHTRPDDTVLRVVAAWFYTEPALPLSFGTARASVCARFPYSEWQRCVTVLRDNFCAIAAVPPAVLLSKTLGVPTDAQLASRHRQQHVPDDDAAAGVSTAEEIARADLPTSEEHVHYTASPRAFLAHALKKLAAEQEALTTAWRAAWRGDNGVVYVCPVCAARVSATEDLLPYIDTENKGLRCLRCPPTVLLDAQTMDSTGAANALRTEVDALAALVQRTRALQTRLDDDNV